MKFFIATKNKKKLAELSRILEPMGHEIMSELDGIVLDEVEETGSDFAANARLKAVSAMKKTGIASIADDSGLCVDALGGAPGIFSARYADANADDNANINKLLTEMAKKKDRAAHFECVICCVFTDGTELFASGRCDGIIGQTVSGTNGFGYDPVFLYNGRSFGCMSTDEKDSVSHRGRALAEFKKKLAKIL